MSLERRLGIQEEKLYSARLTLRYGHSMAFETQPDTAYSTGYTMLSMKLAQQILSCMAPSALGRVFAIHPLLCRPCSCCCLSVASQRFLIIRLRNNGCLSAR